MSSWKIACSSAAAARLDSMCGSLTLIVIMLGAGAWRECLTHGVPLDLDLLVGFGFQASNQLKLHAYAVLALLTMSCFSFITCSAFSHAALLSVQPVYRS